MVLRPLDDPTNKIVRAAAHLIRSRAARERARQTVLEGPHLVDEAVRTGSKIRCVLYSNRLLRRPEGEALLDKLTGGMIRTVYVTDRLLDSLSELERHQGIVSVAEVDVRVVSHLDEAPVLVLNAVQDPGNVGAMIRSAAAFGFRVAMTPGTVDPFNPKVIRASAGAIFHCGLTLLEDGFDVDPALSLVAADPHEGMDYRSWAWPATSALVVGNEGAGISAAIRDMGPSLVRIPMDPGAESLNVAVAAGILMAEAHTRFTRTPARDTVHRNLS
jgi:TrmH family RNA methyltransferase